MDRLSIVLGLVLVCASTRADGPAPVPVKLSDGKMVQCVEVMRWLGTNVQFRDTEGKVRIARGVDQGPETVAALRGLPASGRLISQPVAAESDLPRFRVSIIHIGTKNSTAYSYGRTEWGSSIRTTTNAATFSAAITLASPGTANAKVVTVIGGKVKAEMISFSQGREVSVRITEDDRTTTITDLKLIEIYEVQRDGGRARPFVQIQQGNRVLAEAGELPGHKPGVLLAIEDEKSKSGAFGFGSGK